MNPPASRDDADRAGAAPILGGLAAARAAPTAGFSFRAWGERKDFEAMVDVFNAARAVDRISISYEVGKFEAIFAAWEFDPRECVILAAAGSAVIGWVRMFDLGTGGKGRLLSHRGYVHPEWRRRGVGNALLRGAQAHLRLAEAQDPAPPDAQVKYDAELADSEVATMAMLDRDGYRAEEYGIEMIRSDLKNITSDELPPGVEVRPVRPEDALSVLRAMNEVPMRPGDVPSRDAVLAARVDNPILGQLDVWQVAWAGDEVVGGVLGWIDHEENESENRRRGYTEYIFTREPWRRRGIASALIARNLRLLRDRGMTEAALGIATDNPDSILPLFRRHGFQEEQSYLNFRRSVRSAR